MAASDSFPFNWIQVGIWALLLGLAIVFTYGQKDKTRKKKFLYMSLYLFLHAVLPMAFAFGQTWLARDDGIKVVKGRYALIAATQFCVSALVAMSISESKFFRKVQTLLGFFAGVFVLFMGITPSIFPDTKDSLILWTSWSCGVPALIFVFNAAQSMGWLNWLNDAEELEQTEGGSADAYDGKRNTQPNWVRLLVSLGCLVCMLLYPMVSAIGPDGWREAHKSQLTNLMLFMFVCDAVTTIFLCIVYVFVHPDSSTQMVYFNFLNSSTDEDDRQLLMTENQLDAKLSSAETAAPVASRTTNATAAGAAPASRARTLSPTQVRGIGNRIVDITP